MSEPFPPGDLPDEPIIPQDPVPVPEEPVPEPDPPVEPGWMEAEVSGDRVNVFDAPIIAGDPSGARIEIRSTGFHAFNGVGTETAHIDGAEGVFVGGEFRTSDTLPGQVTLADDAYTSSTTGITYPGIRVDPIDATLTETPPGIGSYGRGIIVDGGKDTSGESSYIVADPQIAYLRSNRADGGAGGEISTNPEFSYLRSYREGGGMGGSIQTTPASSTLRSYRTGGGIGGEIQTAPEFSTLRSYRTGGGMGGEMQTTPEFSALKTYRADGTAGSEIQTSPEFSVLKTYRADGGDGGEVVSSPDRSRVRTYSGNGDESGWMMAQPDSAEIASLDSSNAYVSQIKASATEAFLYATAGGTRRYLSVDADGVWVKTNKSGSFKNYNLEETAQDSGWIPITPVAGVTGSASLAWRNKGGVIYFRGTITGRWATTGTWYTVIDGLPASTWPAFATYALEAGSLDPGVTFRRRADDKLDIQVPAARNDKDYTYRVAAVVYPVG